MSKATKNAAVKGAKAATARRKARAEEQPTLADVLNASNAYPTTNRGQVSLWESMPIPERDNPGSLEEDRPLILLFKGDTKGEGWIDLLDSGFGSAIYVPVWLQGGQVAYWSISNGQWFEPSKREAEDIRSYAAHK